MSGVACRPFAGASGRPLLLSADGHCLRSGAVSAAEDPTDGDGEDEADGSAA